MPNLKEISFRLRNSKLLPLLECHMDHNPNTPVLDKVHSFSIYTWGPENRVRWASPNIRNLLRLMPDIENISTYPWSSRTTDPSSDAMNCEPSKTSRS